ncbi:MAG: hypothetical protein MJ211_01620 [Bacteroidales bacterium]|nr:hypothetical protein [Bacteroidales bacterium]
MKKFLICAAIAVAGVAAWAASDNNAFKADDADAQGYIIEAYGQFLGLCFSYPRTCSLSSGYITYVFPDRANVN